MCRGSPRPTHPHKLTPSQTPLHNVTHPLTRTHPHTPGLTPEVLRQRATAVAGVALDRALDHLRRGACDTLWAALQECVDTRLAAAESAVMAAESAVTVVTPGGGGGATATAGRKRKGRQQQQQREDEVPQEQGVGEGTAAATAAAEARAAVASCARGLQLYTQAVAFFRWVGG